MNGLPLAWRFSAGDKKGNWAWTDLGAQDYKQVLEKLHEFETKNWDDIIKSGSHLISVDKIIKKARDRLRDIKQDDVDELMSFRLTGKNRVWCIQNQNIMRVLWWDPSHQVCPARKKHT